MCHVFSPSHAVLSAILGDDYLTSEVRTKEGDKVGSNQPLARDPVQFKLELMPNYLISYLENTDSRSTRMICIHGPSEWELNPSKISREKQSWRCETSFLNITGAKISTKGIWGMRVDSNPPISISRPLVVQNHNPAPRRDVCLVMIRWLGDLNRRAYLKYLWLRFLHWLKLSFVHTSNAFGWDFCAGWNFLETFIEKFALNSVFWNKL